MQDALPASLLKPTTDAGHRQLPCSEGRLAAAGAIQGRACHYIQCAIFRSSVVNCGDTSGVRHTGFGRFIGNAEVIENQLFPACFATVLVEIVLPPQSRALISACNLLEATTAAGPRCSLFWGSLVWFRIWLRRRLCLHKSYRGATRVRSGVPIVRAVHMLESCSRNQ